MVERIENGNGHTFGKWWSKTSLTLISGLLGLLMMLCFSIVGYNFAQDTDRKEQIEKLKTCKVDRDQYISDIGKIEDALRMMNNNISKTYDKLNEYIEHAPPPHIHTNNGGTVRRVE